MSGQGGRENPEGIREEKTWSKYTMFEKKFK